MAVAHVFDGVVILVVGIGLVDGVVREMHEEVVEVLAVWQLVVLSCETDQSLVVEVYSQRVA